DRSAAVTELIEERASQRRATVLDVDPAAVSASTGGSSAPSVSRALAQLAVECGYVVTPTAAVRTALGDLQVRSLVVPAMLTRARAAALRSAGVAPGLREAVV